MKQLCLAVALIFTSVASYSSTHAPAPKPINIHGNLAHSACYPAERKKINQAIQTLVPNQNPAMVEATVHALLCGTTKKDQGLIIQSIALGAKHTAQDGLPEEQTTRKLPTAQDKQSLMAKGKAYGVAIESSSWLDKTALHIHYWRDEACIESVILAFQKNQWMIVKASGACD